MYKVGFFNLNESFNGAVYGSYIWKWGSKEALFIAGLMLEGVGKWWKKEEKEKKNPEIQISGAST